MKPLYKALASATALTRRSDLKAATSQILATLQGGRTAEPLAEMAGWTARGPGPHIMPSGKLMRDVTPGQHGMDARRATCRHGALDYLLYVPGGVTSWRGLIVMLHGCTQSPDDFAAGTAMNAIAQTRGLIVAYPAQRPMANAQKCWNWFDPAHQSRDQGEPAIIADMAEKLAREFGIGRDSTAVAGLSAGAAMAVIAANSYPDVFAGVGAHSGLARGAATDMASAFAVMRGQERPGAAGRHPVKPSPVRTIIFHGTADRIVALANAAAVERDALSQLGQSLRRADGGGTINGRSFTRTSYVSADGVAQVESWLVRDLAHAWSGGSPNGSYTDTAGPDASGEIARFLFGPEK